MKARDYLFARSDRDSGTIGIGISGRIFTMRYVGASLPASALPGEEVTSFTLHPKERGTGVVAVVLWGPTSPEKNPRYEHFTFFLEVKQDMEGNCAVDLDSLWLSSRDRIGQIVPNGDSPFIRVRIGDDLFTSHSFVPGARIVKDSNLLCRYLAGDVEAEAVKAAATEVEAEKSELERAKAELERMNREMALYKKERSELLAEGHKTRRDLDEVTYRCEALAASLRGRQIWDPIIDLVVKAGIALADSSELKNFERDTLFQMLYSLSLIHKARKKKFGFRSAVGKIFEGYPGIIPILESFEERILD